MPITSHDIAFQDIIDRLNFAYAHAGSLYSNIAGAATTQVKTGAGILRDISVNAAALNGTITVYDNTASSGTKIATITFPALALLQSQVQLSFNCAFSTGLRVVTTGAGLDITIIYE